LKKLNLKSIYILFILAGFILYGNTLGHEFALDDALVYSDNEFTKKGFAGIWDQLSNDQFMGFYGEKKQLVSGGRYRPLSMVMFNVQYAINGESPFLGHLFNVLCYILNGILLYLVLQKLLQRYKFDLPYLNFPLIVSLLWFFHPIHTEVVANIKGLDEMMAFVFEMLTVLCLLKYLEQRKAIQLVQIALLYFLALLSKENALTWLAVIPFMIYFFTDHTFKKALPAYGTLLGLFLVWFAIRYQVIGGGISSVADNLMNDPFLDSTLSEKYATIVLTLGKYIQLLFYPHPLTYDYYPKHIPIVNWQNIWVILSLLFYVFLIILSIKGFFQKKIIAFGILIYFITLSIASNLIFPIGAFMNERFVYVSSLGFAIISGYFLTFVISKWIKKKKDVPVEIMTVFLLILATYGQAVIARNPVWKNNFTLATHDANVSINGAKSNVMAGGLLTEEAAKQTDPVKKKEMLERAIFHLKRAVNIYPEYIDAHLLMGNALFDYSLDAKQAIPYYLNILNINPSRENAWQNIFIVLEQAKDADYKINTYIKLLDYDANRSKIYLNLGRAFGRDKNDLNNSLLYLERGLQRFPNDFSILTNLGTAYGIQGNYVKAQEVLIKASQLRPNDSNTQVNLGLSYFHNGQLDLAKIAFDKAVELDPKKDRTQFPI